MSFSSQSSGYALPVALGFVGLLSLLSIAFAVHLRIESGRLAGGLDSERARLAALYGLAEGLAAVRQATGRDTVVTAAYEAGGDVGPTGWTGVWDTVDGSLLRILVSGAMVGELARPTGDRVFIARRGAGDWVAAYLEEGEAGAHHAWWVDDEGRKAALLACPPVGVYSEPNGGTLAQVLAPLAALPGGAISAGDEAPPTLAEALLLRSRLIDISGLGHHPRWQAVDVAALRADFTVSSRGVLSNTLAGGLRRNLATVDGMDDGSSWTVSLRRVLSRRVGEDGMLEPRGVVHDPGGDDAEARLEDAPRPVVTEVGLYLWLARHPAPAQHRLKVHLTVRLNLWNPYAARLRGADGTGGPALFIEPGRLPPMVAEWRTGDGARSGLFQINPATLIWRPDSTQMSGDPIPLERLPVAYPYLNPGEVRTFSIRLAGLLDEELIDPTPHRYTDDDYSLRAAAGRSNFTLRLADDSLVVDFRTLEFGAADSSDYRRLPLRAVSMTGSPAYGDAALLWHWALREEMVWSGGDEGQKWQEPPSPAIRSARFPFTADGDLDQLAGIYRLSPNPGAAPLDLQVFAGRPAVFYGGNGSLARNYLALYDYATTHPASLAYLMNFPLVDKEEIGANTRYDIFDRFYFLPEDGDLSPREQWLFGNRYSTGGSDSDSDTAPLLLGAFNINSTSVGAWRAVLASRAIHNWSYRVLSNPRQAGDLANTVFRFPHSARFSAAAPWEVDAAYPEGAADTQALWYRDSWAPQWMRAWASGIRLLSEAETEALASAIVAQLRQRQRPFLSLAEAASEPWLQEAIDRTAINAIGDRPYLEADPQDRFPRHSPSFVSQEDVIALIAPFWAVRSDTFTIRAYGRIDGPHGSPAAEAWCEARVQRLPTGDRNSRPFEIEHFRWLPTDDL